MISGQDILRPQMPSRKPHGVERSRTCIAKSRSGRASRRDIDHNLAERRIRAAGWNGVRHAFHTTRICKSTGKMETRSCAESFAPNHSSQKLVKPILKIGRQISCTLPCEELHPDRSIRRAGSHRWTIIMPVELACPRLEAEHGVDHRTQARDARRVYAQRIDFKMTSRPAIRTTRGHAGGIGASRQGDPEQPLRTISGPVNGPTTPFGLRFGDRPLSETAAGVGRCSDDMHHGDGLNRHLPGGGPWPPRAARARAHDLTSDATSNGHPDKAPRGASRGTLR